MALSPSCINARVNVYYQYRLVSIVGFSVECFCTDMNQTNQSMYYMYVRVVYFLAAVYMYVLQKFCYHNIVIVDLLSLRRRVRDGMALNLLALTVSLLWLAVSCCQERISSVSALSGYQNIAVDQLLMPCVVQVHDCTSLIVLL